MSKIINGGLDQYGPEPFKQQQFGAAGVEMVKNNSNTAVWPNATYRSQLAVWSRPGVVLER